MKKGRASVRKKIMQGAELLLCGSTLQAAREMSERLSAPWLKGMGIIPAKQVVTYKTEVDAKIRDFFAAADAFCAKRDEIIARDRHDLNGAFRESDYPTASELRAKFYAEIAFEPVATDFRCEGIDAQDLAEMQRSANAAIETRVREAKRDLCARLAERLVELTDKLNAFKPSDKKGRFHDATVTNVSDTCAEVRDANFDDDKTVNAIAAKVEKAIAKLSIDGIKANDAERDEAKQAAEAMLAEVQAAMSAFVI